MYRQQNTGKEIKKLCTRRKESMNSGIDSLEVNPCTRPIKYSPCK